MPTGKRSLHSSQAQQSSSSVHQYYCSLHGCKVPVRQFHHIESISHSLMFISCVTITTTTTLVASTNPQQPNAACLLHHLTNLVDILTKPPSEQEVATDPNGDGHQEDEDYDDVG